MQALAEACASKRTVGELWKTAEALRADADAARQDTVALRTEVEALRAASRADAAQNAQLHRQLTLLGQMVDAVAT